MADEHTPREEEDFLAPDVTLERLTEVLNEVLAIPGQEGLGLVIRAQVERAGVTPAEALEQTETSGGTQPNSPLAEADQVTSEVAEPHTPDSAS